MKKLLDCQIVAILLLFITANAFAQEVNVLTKFNLVKIQSLKSSQNDTQKMDVAKSLVEAVADATNYLKDKFSTAAVFSNTARNMMVLDEKNVVAIDKAISKTDKIMKYVAWLPTLIGTGFIIKGKDQQAVWTGTGASAVFAILFNSNSTDLEEHAQNASTQINESIEKLKSKMENLSVNAFLGERIIESGMVVEALKKQSMDLYAATQKEEITINEGVKIGNDYVSLLRATDSFYETNLTTLKLSINRKIDEAGYTEDTKKELRNLVVTIDEAISSWRSIRPTYAKTETITSNLLVGL